jgi:uncharacterized damage-inducible protein DinB
MDPLKIYNCNVHARERILDVVRSLPPEQYNREFSIGLKTFGSTLTHIMLAEWSYNQRIRGEAVPPYEQWPIQYENPPSFEVIEAKWREQTAQTRETIVGERDWDKEFTYTSSRPPQPSRGEQTYQPIRVTVTPTDVITQMLLHEVHHRAQLMAMLREIGTPVENLDFAYFGYKREEIC